MMIDRQVLPSSHMKTPMPPVQPPRLTYSRKRWSKVDWQLLAWMVAFASAPAILALVVFWWKQ